MKKKIVTILLAVPVCIAVAAEPTLREYVNPRFGYAFRYPASLVAGPERADGSGRDFESQDGNFKVEVYARPVAGGSDYLANRFKKELGWFGSAVTYKVRKPDWYVVSGVTAEGLEFYSKGFTNGSLLTSFRITYPHVDHRRYDRWVERIEKNFQSAQTAPAAGSRVPDPAMQQGDGRIYEPRPLARPQQPVAPAPAPAVAERPPVSKPAPTARPASRSSYPVAQPVPNKPGFVTSPYSKKSEYIDVRGFPPGTEVKDPYTGKIFLVP